MTLTEEEARKKWCPFARQQSTMGGRSFNRRQKTLPRACLCIASECMAWRWRVTPAVAAMPFAQVETPIGFCGLAGQP